jgi:hypothetical protein
MYFDVNNSIPGFAGSRNAGGLPEPGMKDLTFSIPGRIYQLKA